MLRYLCDDDIFGFAVYCTFFFQRQVCCTQGVDSYIGGEAIRKPKRGFSNPTQVNKIVQLTFVIQDNCEKVFIHTIRPCVIRS